MRAAWWWIDRWRQSTAYTDMTAEEQGLYRNLLDEVWLRDDHVIPDDPRILAKVSGDPEAWSRCSKRVLGWMTRVETGWTHTTAMEVIDQSRRRAENQKRYREKRHNKSDNASDNKRHNKPDSLSQSPSPSQEQNTAARPQPLRPPAVERPANPLVVGRRVDLEREFLALVSEIAKLTDRDPLEVAREATGYEGARTTPINPASMSDDRLANSVMDLRSNLGAAKKRQEAESRGIREARR